MKYYLYLLGLCLFPITMMTMMHFMHLPLLIQFLFIILMVGGMLTSALVMNSYVQSKVMEILNIVNSFTITKKDN